MSRARIIQVYADWEGLKAPLHAGALYCELVRGKEIFSFTASQEWLERAEAGILDPDLGRYGGRQYLRDGKPNFGLFLDSSPDRWGRSLIKKREALKARQEGRKAETLHESDFLLGVFDGNRMGALRFKLEPQGDFLNNNREMAAPPWASIRDLEYASIRIEDDDTETADYNKWLSLLINPGSSLGGARPKAAVVDQKGALWIAKFPSGRDEIDVGAWEKVVNELALRSGINVPESNADIFSSRHHTFLSRRFDRTPTGGRIHFASAMTLLGKSDGDDFSTGTGYLDLAEFISRQGSNVESNLEELWRRVVFNIAVSNGDDHLRNHGFLLSGSGWVLSPAYDMNPDERCTGLKLNISEDDNSLDFDLALEVIPYFRLPEKKARKILAGVKNAVSLWRQIARGYGISRSEQEYMEGAFRL